VIVERGNLLYSKRDFQERKMDEPKKKTKAPKWARYLMAYALGFSCWLSGLYCAEIGAGEAVTVSGKKLLRHLATLGLGSLALFMVGGLLLMHRAWFLPFMIVLGVAGLLMFFLYKKAFWQKPIAFALPGFKVFLCPQCYQKQAFFFTPASFQYAFFVTYLCRYCSCLVNAWGEQMLYPQNVPSGKISLLLAKALVSSLAVLACSFFLAWKITCFFT
jgi:hypothetical protein